MPSDERREGKLSDRPTFEAGADAHAATYERGWKNGRQQGVDAEREAIIDWLVNDIGKEGYVPGIVRELRAGAHHGH